MGVFRNFRVHILLPMVLLMSASDAAFAVAPLSLCVNVKSGVMSAKAKCGKGETKLSRANFGSLGVATPGPVGPQGPAGILDPNRCVTRSSPLKSGTTFLLTSVECEPGEFLLTHGVQTFTGVTSVVAISLLFLPGKSYPTGVTYETLNTPTGPYEVQVDGVCCK